MRRTLIVIVVMGGSLCKNAVFFGDRSNMGTGSNVLQNNTADVMRIFFPYTFQKLEEMQIGKKLLAHYTTASAAFEIIRSKTLWFRQGGAMNDFLEFKYGRDCLISVLSGPVGQRLYAILSEELDMSPNAITKFLNRAILFAEKRVYIACLSEHDLDADSIGKLSMWRAYGKETGTALVISIDNLAYYHPRINIYSSAVAYWTKEEFVHNFGLMLDEVERSLSFVRQITKSEIWKILYGIVRFSVHCVKHPGFREEREWRFIYSNWQLPDKIKIAFQTVHGHPQLVAMLPLEKFEGTNVDFSIRTILRNIIIGPSQYPVLISDAFKDLLRSVSAFESTRITVSDIPLRT